MGVFSSCRMFSEGRNLAPQEDKMFRRRLKEETKQISATEKSIFSELELFESKSLQQVRKVSSALEDKLSSLRAEVKFTDEVQKIISRTQIQIKAEVASSNLQQSKLSSRLEDLRMMMKNMQVHSPCSYFLYSRGAAVLWNNLTRRQDLLLWTCPAGMFPSSQTSVSPDQICSFFSSTNEQMKMRCFYLDFNLDSAVKESLALSAHPEPREQVRSGSLQLSRTAVDLREEPAVSAVRSVEQRQHHLCCHVSRQMLQLCFFTFSNDPNPAGSLCSRIQAQKTSREEEKLQVSKKQLHLLALTGFTEGFVVHLGVLSSGF
ncbi:hypothetical protein XENORESO_018023 [Xenotaenia resolanae]|uniref:Uncharacterized protein n=1 Tax=Xenotaenia resolanae TaxID=208358 RepID=A0ABV0WXD4_9TELE